MVLSLLCKNNKILGVIVRVLRLRPEIAWSAGIVAASFVCSFARILFCAFAPLRPSCRPPHFSPPNERTGRLHVAIVCSGDTRISEEHPSRLNMMGNKMDASRAVKLKDEGNALFRKANYKEALGKYSQGTQSCPQPPQKFNRTVNHVYSGSSSQRL